MKRAGIFTIGTATTVEEARRLQSCGIDAVCAQGAEAGGHRGTFIGEPENALVGTLSLTPQVVDAVGIPVVAAGGISDGRAVAAVLALGAVAAQCGTAFLRAHEAGTAPAYRRALENASEDETMLTRAFSGRLARGIRNRFAVEVNDPRKHAPYPYQNALTRDLRQHASRLGNADMLSLWAGQSFPLAREASAADIVHSLMREAATAATEAATALSRVTLPGLDSA